MGPSVRQAIKERSRACKWFRALNTQAKWDLGDALVLGTFDWHEWGFTSKPSRAFMREVDYERMLWESEGD